MAEEAGCFSGIVMIQHEELREDFPELFEVNVNLSKEVLAHFGLVFSAFALLEASLQNCFVICGLDDKLRRSSLTAEAWKEEAEVLERRAFKATFGTLLRLLDDREQLKTLHSGLRKLKNQRDYFAHSFFREESENMFCSERQLFLIAAMANLRRNIEAAESAIDRVCAEVMKSWNPAKDWEGEIDQLASKLKVESLSKPRLQAGWIDPQETSGDT